MKRFRTIGLVAALTLVAAAVWFAWSRSEPVYRGHPMTYWVEPAQYLLEQDSDAKAAYAEMDEKAVNWLIDQLGWKPSFFVEGLNWMGRPLKLVVPDKPDRRYYAALVLARLGAKASNAIPVLKLTLEDKTVHSGSPYPHPAARFALFRIQNEPIENLIGELATNASGLDRKWGIAALALAQMNDDAAQAVPHLADGLNATNSSLRRHYALFALEAIASRPDDCVPQLVECMRSSFRWERERAMRVLRKFGPEAVAAGEAAEAASPPPTK